MDLNILLIFLNHSNMRVFIGINLYFFICVKENTKMYLLILI